MMVKMSETHKYDVLGADAAKTISTAIQVDFKGVGEVEGGGYASSGRFADEATAESPVSLRLNADRGT